MLAFVCVCVCLLPSDWSGIVPRWMQENSCCDPLVTQPDVTYTHTHTHGDLFLDVYTMTIAHTTPGLRLAAT